MTWALKCLTHSVRVCTQPDEKKITKNYGHVFNIHLQPMRLQCRRLGRRKPVHSEFKRQTDLFLSPWWRGCHRKSPRGNTRADLHQRGAGWNTGKSNWERTRPHLSEMLQSIQARSPQRQARVPSMRSPRNHWSLSHERPILPEVHWHSVGRSNGRDLIAAQDWANHDAGKRRRWPT